MNKIYNYLIIFISFLLQMGAQAQVAVFNPAEFEKNEGIMMVWDYQPSRDTVVANIARIAQQAGKVWIVYYPGQAPYDTTAIRSFLYEMGATSEHLYFIPAYTETLWIRDFGPMTLYGNFGQGNERFVYDMGYAAYNRPKDDSIPAQIAHLWNWQKRDLELQIEGGNLIFDGLTRGFATTRVHDQNPGYSPSMIRNILIDKFNQMDFTFLQPLENSGGGIWRHIDMFMKVLDYETIIVSSYPDYLPDYQTIENNVMQLQSLSNHFGKPYNIIRIPAPPKADGTYATTLDDEMRTYTNSLIINNTVIVPTYNQPDFDAQALQIYSDAMPGYKIIPVDARQLTILGGAIHCITKEIPSTHFMRIIHRKVVGLQSYTPEMYIYSNCESNTGIQGMWLYYKVNDQENYSRVPVYMACPQNIGIIEGLQPGDKVSYYLEGVSVQDTMTYPGGAPAANFTFWFDGTVSTPSLDAKETSMHLLVDAANHTFVIAGEKLPDEGILSVYNLSGSLVHTQLARKGERLHIDLPNAIYVATYEGQNLKFSAKLPMLR